MLESILLKDGTIEDAARYAIVAHYKKGNNAFLVTTKDKTIISSEPLRWENEPYNQEINLRRKFG